MSPLWVSNFYTIALPTHDNVTITLLLVQCSLYSEEIRLRYLEYLQQTDGRCLILISVVIKYPDNHHEEEWVYFRSQFKVFGGRELKAVVSWNSWSHHTRSRTEQWIKSCLPVLGLPPLHTNTRLHTAWESWISLYKNERCWPILYHGDSIEE